MAEQVDLDWLKCPFCGYDLRGLPENRCPECGKPFDPELLRVLHRYVAPPSTRGEITFEYYSKAVLALPLLLLMCVLVGAALERILGAGFRLAQSTLDAVFRSLVILGASMGAIGLMRSYVLRLRKHGIRLFHFWTILYALLLLVFLFAVLVLLAAQWSSSGWWQS